MESILKNTAKNLLLIGMIILCQTSVSAKDKLQSNCDEKKVQAKAAENVQLNAWLDDSEDKIIAVPEFKKAAKLAKSKLKANDKVVLSFRAEKSGKITDLDLNEDLKYLDLKRALAKVVYKASPLDAPKSDWSLKKGVLAEFYMKDGNLDVELSKKQ